MPRCVGLILLTASLVSPAHAAPWQSGELRPLPVEGPVHTVAISNWAGEAAVIVAGPESVTVFGTDGAVVATADSSTSSLVIEDLDTDGTPEVIACGPAGLEVLRPGDEGGLGESISLSTEPCEQVVALQGDLYASLVTLGEGKVRVLTPGGDGLVAAEFAGPTNPSVLVATGSRFAVIGDTVVTGPEPHTLEVESGVVAMGPDGDSWLVGFGGDSPRLVLADGTELPLPSAPTWVRRASLAQPDDLLVGLGSNQVAMRLDGEPLEVVELLVSAEVFGLGDLDGDGCTDLVTSSADGTEAAISMGSCGVAAPLAVPVDEPAPPPVESDPPVDSAGLELGEEWALLELVAEVPVERQLVDAVHGWDRFGQRGGPKGLHLSEAGLLSFTPTQSQVGLWRVSIVIAEGSEERWTGLVMRVRATEDSVGGGSILAVDRRKPPIVLEPEEEPRAGRREPSRLSIRECRVSVGVAAGLSRNAQSSWTNVGLPSAVVSGSPEVALVCAGGGTKVRWFVGADSAPTFFYISPSGRRNHVLAATLGVEWNPGPVRIGAFGNLGFVVAGVGLRAVWLPITTQSGAKQGLEARFTAYPMNLAGQVMLGYTWEFGAF